MDGRPGSAVPGGSHPSPSRSWGSVTGDRTCCGCSPSARTSMCAGCATRPDRGSSASPVAIRTSRRPTRLDDVLDDPEVDGVLLATPVFTHYDLARRCLEAGKHTLVEKPLAASGVEALALIDSRRRARPRADVRAHVPLQPAGARGPRADRRAASSASSTSSPRAASTSACTSATSASIWDLGPHDFSILLYWLGEPPSDDPRDRARLDRPGHRRCRVRDDGVPLGRDRQRRAELARAEQAAPHRASSARRRWSSTRTGPPSRSGSSTAASSTRTPRRSASTTSPTAPGDILSPQLSSDEPLALQAGDFVRTMRTGAAAGARPCARERRRPARRGRRGVADPGRRADRGRRGSNSRTLAG